MHFPYSIQSNFLWFQIIFITINYDAVHINMTDLNHKKQTEEGGKDQKGSKELSYTNCKGNVQFYRCKNQKAS